jgi:ferredoxin-nitrate reductase
MNPSRSTIASNCRTWEQVVKGDAQSLAERAAGRVEFIPGVAITRIDRPSKTVVDAQGTRHLYDLLIIATGSRAAKLYQGHMPKQGVHFLRRRGDADAIRERAGQGKRAIVIGGGLLGLELADALVEIGTSVTVLQRSERLMGRQLDAKAAAYLAEALAVRGVAIRFKAQVDTLLGQDLVTGVTLTDGTLLQSDLVIFATGTAPNAEIARTALLACSTGILINQQLQTSDPSIYAIGEVADFKSQAAATTAAAERQAWHLVEHLRGNPHAPYPGPINSNILKVHGVQLASIGETDPTDASCQSLVFEDQDRGIYQKLVIKDDRVIGVLLFGDTTGFAAYRDLVASGTELEDRRETLLRGSAAKPVEGRLVCSCNQVGEGTLVREIAGGCSTLAQLCAKTAAGTACGSCRSEVGAVLATQLKKTEDVSGAPILRPVATTQKAPQTLTL